MHEVLARTVRGLEAIAETEAHALLGVERATTGHRELRFAVPELTRDLLGLGTVDDVFLVVASVDGIGRIRGDLERIAEAARTIDLSEVVALVEPVRRLTPRRHVDAVGSFVGRRNFNRYALEDALGEALRLPRGWKYHSRTGGGIPPADGLSLRVHVDGSEATIAARLGERPLHRRAYRLVTRPGSLHAPVARAMALLAGLAPQLRLLDPFCGVGTIPIEGALACPELEASGVDIAAEAIAAARQNAAAAGVRAAFSTADAAGLSLPDGSVDRVVTNPPWGTAVGLVGDPLRAWRELGRVLAAAGVVVVLVPAADESEEAVREADLEVVQRNRIRLFGALADIVVCARGPAGQRGLSHNRHP